MTNKTGRGAAPHTRSAVGAVRREAADAALALKLRAQQLAEAGKSREAEAIVKQVLVAQPDDAEALALLAVIDSDRGGHALAVRRGLRAAQLTHWQSAVICANLAMIIRRVAHQWERARIIRKGFPILARQLITTMSGGSPQGPFDVVVLFPGSPSAPSRFEQVFSLQAAGAGRVIRVSQDGSVRDKIREVLARTASGLLLFVHADDVPLEGLTVLVTLLERSSACDWAYGQVTSIEEGSLASGSAYGQYRQALARLSKLPCPDFALFERTDVTGGVIGIRRAVLERIADQLPELPFSVRAVAIAAGLDCSAAMIATDVVARSASAFEREGAIPPLLLANAYQRLLANAARNPNAPMPAQWGVLAWSLPVEQGVAAGVSAQHWQRLVEEVEALQTQFTAVRPVPGGVNMIGMPLGMFGLAESMRAFVRAADVADLPNCIGELGLNLKPDQSDFRLLDRLQDRLPYRAAIVFANPDILHKCWPAQLLEPGRYRVGYWFWEFDCLPKEWAYAFELVDEVWVATEFVRAAVERSTGKPVTLMPHPIEVEAHKPMSRSALGLAEDVFWFLVTFDFNSFAERKNPYGAIKAFRSAFRDRSERVGLFIKTINGAVRPSQLAALRDAIGGDSRIALRDQAMPRDEVLALLGAADCYVSLHRSEGLGLGLAESMYLGRPVIGTAYSGNVDFMTDENSCLVKYTFVPVRPDQYIYADTNAFRWAEADIEHAAYFMRKVFADQQFRQSIAERARSDIRSRFDPRSIGQTMRGRLREVGVI